MTNQGGIVQLPVNMVLVAGGTRVVLKYISIISTTTCIAFSLMDDGSC